MTGSHLKGFYYVLFLILALVYFAIPIGVKGIGGISANLLLGLLAWFLGTSTSAVKAAVQLSVWSVIVFLIMALLFIV